MNTSLFKYKMKGRAYGIHKLRVQKTDLPVAEQKIVLRSGDSFELEISLRWR